MNRNEEEHARPRERNMIIKPPPRDAICTRTYSDGDTTTLKHDEITQQYLLSHLINAKSHKILLKNPKKTSDITLRNTEYYNNPKIHRKPWTLLSLAINA